MKKIFTITALIAFAGWTIGQSLQKDNVFTLHVLDVNPIAGVTMDQFLDVIYEEYIPALSEAMPDVNFLFLKGIRGNHKTQFGLIVLYESEKGLEKYWSETEATELLEERWTAIVKPVRQKMDALADIDWVTWTIWKVEPVIEEDSVATTAVPEVDLDLSVYPNPFSDHIMFEYELPLADVVRIEVYNSLGQLVATPVHGVQQAGKNTIYWNGCDDAGHPLIDGTYNVRLQTANSTISFGTIIKL